MSGGDFDEVHDSLMHCVCMYYNAMKKTLSRLNEALTRSLKSSGARRDAANILSSASNYFAPRGISSTIRPECKKTYEMQPFLHARRAPAHAVAIRAATRANALADVRVAFDSARFGAKNFFGFLR